MLLLGLAGVGNCGQEKERSLKANIKSHGLLGRILTMTILSISHYHHSQTSLSLESGSLRLPSVSRLQRRGAPGFFSGSPRPQTKSSQCC